MAIRVSNVTAQALINPSTVVRNVTDELNFQQETQKRALVVNNVTFQALIPATPAFGRIPTNALNLQQEVFELLVVSDRTLASNELLLNQEVTIQNFPFLTQNLGLSDEAISSIKNLDVTDHLGLNDAVLVCFGLPSAGISITDTIKFVHFAGRAYELEVDHGLGLSDTTASIGAVSHTLNFQQQVIAGLGHMVSNTLNLQQVIGTESDFVRSVTHSDFIKQAFTFYIDDGCNRRDYVKFEGEGPETTPFPDQRLEFKSDFVIETLTGPKQQLVLRSPETDDRDRLGFTRVNRETRGGELNVFADPNWSKVNTLLFTIVALKPDKLNSLHNFLFATLGQEILLQDWTGSTWHGVVTTPDEAATEDRDGWWTFSFEFEGEPYDGPANDQHIAFDDEVTFIADYKRPASDTLMFEQIVTVGGDLNHSASNSMLLAQTIGGELSVPLILDDFSGSGNLDGQSADIGGSWSAHTAFQADGTMTSVNSGAYLPFSPSSGTKYGCEWKVRNINEAIIYENVFDGPAGNIHNTTPDRTTGGATFWSADTFEEDGSIQRVGSGSTGMYLPFTPAQGKQYYLECQIRNLDSTGETTQDLYFFMGKGLSSPQQDSGPDASGMADPTMLAVGHVFKSQTGNNMIRLGDGMTPSAVMSDYTDTTLRDTDTDMDMRILLDTTGGAGNWRTTLYARAAGALAWTDISGSLAMMSEDIGAIGVGVGDTLTGDITYLKLYEDTTPSTQQNQELRFFVAETQPATVLPGSMYDGTEGITSLKAGFVLQELLGVSSNAARLGDLNDGTADTVLFSDAGLQAERSNLDVRLLLDTTVSPWTAEFFAKLPSESDWTQVRAPVPMLDQTIGGVGMASDPDAIFEIEEIKVNEERAI